MEITPARSFIAAMKQADTAIATAIVDVTASAKAAGAAADEAQRGVALLDLGIQLSKTSEYAPGLAPRGGAAPAIVARTAAARGVEQLRAGETQAAVGSLGEARTSIERLKSTIAVEDFAVADATGSTPSVAWEQVLRDYRAGAAPTRAEDAALSAAYTNLSGKADDAARATDPIAAPAAGTPDVTPVTSPTAATPPPAATSATSAPPARATAAPAVAGAAPAPGMGEDGFYVIEPDSPLAKYGRDLTQEALDGKLDPIAGRSKELNQLIEVLGRKTKNNPVLLGEPGVGKSAVVEALAQRVAAGDVPPKLQGVRVVSLEMSALMAGSGKVGELEERLAPLLKQIADSDGKVVPFVDELHQIMSAAGQTGSVGDMLKPALARGKTRMVGATTLEEYRKIVQKDGAVDRRFQPITVDEPSVDETIDLLRLLRGRLEDFHGVTIDDSALTAAAKHSDRYITDRFLPDKAIDLVDGAAARLGIARATKPAPLDEALRARTELQRQVDVMIARGASDGDAALDAARARVSAADESIATLTSDWERDKTFIARHDEVVAKIAAGRAAGDDAAVAAATADLEALRGEAHAAWKTRPAQVQFEVDEAAIGSVVADRTGIPVARLGEDDGRRLLTLEDDLRTRVTGQDEALGVVARAVRRGRSGMGDPNRPVGSFLFLGPTGVGKTETAKALADTVFDGEKSMVRLDMSEYAEKHAASRLFGAPPGYVGYEEGGELTEAVRRNPYTVVLMDEVEKAHPDVFNSLLQVLEDGRLTDGQGRTVDFRNAVIIMTSNLPSDRLKQFFRPEFLNRLDDTVIFNPLNEEAVGRVVGMQVGRVAERLGEKGITLDVGADARALLATEGFDPTMGARPVKRAIQRLVEDPITDKLLGGEVAAGDTIRVGVDAADPARLGFEIAGPGA